METISCDLPNRNNMFCQTKLLCTVIKEMFHIIENFRFNKCNHSNLKTLWIQAQYVKAEKLRGLMIGANGKYRIWRKYSFTVPCGIGSNFQLF